MLPAPSYRQYILKTTRRVGDAARFVRISRPDLDRLADALLDEADWYTSEPARQQRDADLFSNDSEHAQWLFMLDALNFSFWEEDERNRWRWPREPRAGESARKGAIALGESFRDAQRRGVPLTDTTYLERLTPPVLAEVLGGRGTLPMLDERCAVLNETARVLNCLYEGRVSNLIARAQGDVNRLIAQLVEDFPSFQDIQTIDGGHVYLLKRAQIFVSDLWLVFGGESLGRFDNIEELTAFADYKLPQLLRAARALEYEPELARLVDGRVQLTHGSRAEIEIRAATVQAVELLRERLAKQLETKVYTCRLDNCLWDLSHSPEFESPAPHHMSRTIFY